MTRGELIHQSIYSLGILAASLLAFTKKQRDAIALERDEGRCQAPFPHKCGDGLEVHHIMPQRYANKVGLEDSDIDTPENGITLCKNAHNTIHPDRVEALKNYRQKKVRGEDSFKEMFDERNKKLENRQIYWNDRFDRQMRVIAIKRTRKAQKDGWEFPKKRSR